jgi:hypothetical protein
MVTMNALDDHNFLTAMIRGFDLIDGFSGVLLASA